MTPAIPSTNDVPAVIDPQEEAALKIYPSMRPAGTLPPPPPPPPAPAVASDQREEAALKVYPSMRPADAEHKAPPDGWTALESAPHAAEGLPLGVHVRQEMQRLAEVNGHLGDEAAKVAAGWGRVFEAHGIGSDQEANDLMMAGMDHSRLNGPPDDDTLATWEDAAHEDLRGEYGPDNVPRLLQLAQRYVAASPALHHYLAASGLGSHPKVVKVVVAAARRAQAAGKKF